MSSLWHVALNAHLLSGEASHRSAGIHGYILNTLRCLPAVEPDWRFTALISRGAVGLPSPIAETRSRISTANPLARIVWEQIAAPYVLARLKPDLLHGMAFSLPLAWSKPSVVTIYDLSFVRYPERLGASRRLYLRIATRLAVRRARRVIAISQSGKSEIAAVLNVPPSRIDVALPGVDGSFHPLPASEIAAFRQKKDLPDRFILCVATLEPRKNLETLARAYAMLPQRKAAKLILVGAKGWQTSPLLKVIDELGLHDDVIFPGYVPNDELPLWHNAAEVFAYPSVYEGFGLPLLEALACGTPAVASDATSLPEVVGDAGVLIPPLDVDSWASALARLLDSPAERAERSRRGLDHARQFTWENTARQTVASYHHALGNPS